jgi:ATP-binding protein involved in chromosome partitioning
LGKIPIDLEIGKGGDSGVPLMVSAPNSEAGRIFHVVAEKIMDVMRDQKSATH